ncbi:MBOAT family O-acyltransferase [Rhodocytophaga rosea]|nr:MBOAT family O-acyltransferase [Rhodocytophaga rosea]
MALIPVYILILGFTIVIDYFTGIYIEKANQKRSKKSRYLLIISLVANIGILGIFKYYNFFSENINWLQQQFNLQNTIPYLSIILPVGLSFHTFQAMSYTIEVYRGNQAAEKHFGKYALYVMFFPQLVAGPIERPQNILHQFHQKQDFDFRRITAGLQLIGWGLFKKVVIADRVAILVNEVYTHPYNYQGISLIVATVFFAFQIYCDFSGYSDIALGSAQVMGFNLMQNFNRPYFSTSVAEFWKRWHISLSTWFKDYVYIPLGGNRKGKWKWYFNLLIIFLISGFWHGASWTFIIWGALHGFYMISSAITLPIRGKFAQLIHVDTYPKIHKLIQILTTFALVCFAWIFFRANSITDAYYITTHLFTGIQENIQTIIFNEDGLREKVLFLGDSYYFISGVLLIILLVMIEKIQNNGSIRLMLSNQPLFVRWSVYYLLILAIIFLGIHTKADFIYFQF